MSISDTLSGLIAKFENVNPSYNNPLAVQYGNYALGQGATGKAGNGLAIFPDTQTGLAAGNNLLNSSSYSNLSITQLLNKWQTGNSDTTGQYTNSALSMLGGSGSSSSNPLGSMNPLTSDFWSAAKDYVTGKSGSTDSPTSLNVARFVSIVLGLICISAGLLMFKPVNTIVTSTAKSAAKVITA